MKILHVITTLQTGGAEKLMVDLLPRLKHSGVEVDLCVFDGERTSFRNELEATGVKVYDFGVGNSVYNPLNILRLRKLMRGYDIVHTHNYSPQLFATFGKHKNQKLITTEHNSSNRRRSKKLFKYIDRLMYKKYDHVICIAESTESALNQFVGAGVVPTSVVQNGVDVHKFATAEASQALEQLAPGSKKIIMVAGFRWEKDQDTLIRSLVHLPQEFHLFLVGDGVRRNELENLVKELKLDTRVHFLGVRNDIPQLLHASDYIIMSSHFEGLSLSSVEGMSVGKPFIASDVPGLREVTTGAGILFPHQDHKTLAETITTLDSTPEMYNTIARQCSTRAKQYDINNMVKGYLDVYINL